MGEPSASARSTIAVGIPFGDVERAILRAVVYADVFEYALTADQIERYLLGAVAAPPVVQARVRALVAAGRLLQDGDLYMLPGRERLAAVRAQRARESARLWPVGLRYGRALGQLPYVRMVAITGSLALDNVESEGDIDYLVVAMPGRVWIARGGANLVRRLAQARGVTLCPNFVLSEESLVIRDRNLYTAHELMQMVPVTGHAVYRRMIELNGWTSEYLPNVNGTPHADRQANPHRHVLSRLAERALNTPVGTWLDRLERGRLQRKMARRAESLAEAVYAPDCCKDHTRPHGQRVLAAYAERLVTHDVRAS